MRCLCLASMEDSDTFFPLCREDICHHLGSGQQRGLEGSSTTADNLGLYLETVTVPGNGKGKGRKATEALPLVFTLVSQDESYFHGKMNLTQLVGRMYGEVIMD